MITNHTRRNKIFHAALPERHGIYAILVALGIIFYVRMPVSESYIAGKTSAKNRSTILGIYFFSGMEGGGVQTPVMGYIIDRFGFYASFTAAGAVMLLGTLICTLFLWKK
ncbi:MAG: hypothetical protein H8E10_18855 [Desulfobacterales bacterium]|nr:hypothetical protein [Desulfobacterales bacterium]